MGLNIIKRICNGYLSKKRGFTAEIDSYFQNNEKIFFEIRILKRGSYWASEQIEINKKSGLKPEIQLRSKIQRFTSMIENNLL